MSTPIYLKSSDVVQLKSSMRTNMLMSSIELPLLTSLKNILEEAIIVADEEFPPEAIALGSKVVIEYCDDGERATCQLVLPQDVSKHPGNVSVLAPLGLALLGHTAPQTVDWPLATGQQKLQVKLLHVTPALEPEAVPA